MTFRGPVKAVWVNPRHRERWDIFVGEGRPMWAWAQCYTLNALHASWCEDVARPSQRDVVIETRETDYGQEIVSLQFAPSIQEVA